MGTLDHHNYSPVHTRDLAAIMPQDMPPAGGYDPVQYRRNLPIKGFRPAYYLVAMGAVCTYGLWRYGQGIREQNELAREKMWPRIHLIPLLQAEEDRDLVGRHLASQAMEKELLGAETKVYNSDRCVLLRLWGRKSGQRTHRSLLTRAAQICATNLCSHTE